MHSGVAAVEAHEGIGQAIVELALDLLVIDVLGHGVVDVQQGDGIARHAGADVLAQGAVDVHLAGHRDAPGGQAAVHIAGLKAELGGEGRPALVGEGHILPGALVLLGPVQQGQLKLGHADQHVLIVAALAHLLAHVRADLGDPGIVGMLLVGHQQIQLGVLLDLHAQLIQALDGGVAGEEVLGPGPEGDDLQVAHADDSPGDRDEVGDHLGDVAGGAHGILRDVALQVAHAQVVGAVQHAAVGVAAAVDHVAVALGRRREHHGAVEILGDQGLGGLRTEIAQEHDGGVAALRLQGLHGLAHIQLVFHSHLDLGHGQLLLGALGGDGSAALLTELDRETVAGHGDKADLDFRDVGHHGKTPPCCLSRPVV